MLKVDPQDKESLIDPLYRFSIRFWRRTLILSAIVLWGLYMYIRQLTAGLGETGLNRPAFWGMYMVNFIFLIGVSMAGTLISAALQLTDSHWRRPITRVAETMTVFGLLIAAMQIMFDMGRPDKALFVVQFGRLQSPLLWDMTSLTAYILTSMLALYLQLLPDIAILRDNFPTNGPTWRRQLYTWLAIGWRGNREQWMRLEKAIKVISILIIPIGISLHTVTSWIFSTTVQPGWQSTILGPYFVVGAIFSGIGMLFIVMTIFRQRMRLHDYFGDRQYRNLGWLFIVMSGVWFYFTYTEHLTMVAAQEAMEFPVLASKLWGSFAPTFWGMVALMGIATWVLIAPKLIPNSARAIPTLRPLLSVPLGSFAVLLGVVLFVPTNLPEPVVMALEDTGVKAGLGILTVALTANTMLSIALWFKSYFVPSLVFASACVVVGMWLERWNIIVPTVTHPRLVAYADYAPTIVELSITVASFALLILLSLLFFKLFPVVSIWETSEGRVIDAEYAKVSIPLPESSYVPRGSRGFRRRKESIG